MAARTPPPRLVKFGAIWTVASVVPTVVLLLIGQPFWADWILSARGITTAAEVLSYEALPNDSHEGGSSIIDLRARFHDKRGRAFILEGYYTSGDWGNQIPETNRVQVEYDPDYPNRNRVKGESASLVGYWVFLPLWFVLIGVVLLGFALHVWRLEARLCSVAKSQPRQ